jgi:hypothetical protein
LFSGDDVVATAELVAGENVVVFEELLSNQAYRIEVVTTYDLFELAGPREDQTLYESEVQTNEKEVPTVVEDNNIRPTTDTITFDLRIIDPDGVVLPETIEIVLLRNGEEVDRMTVSSLIVNDITFSGLTANTPYDIEVYADQDYNIGGEIEEDMLIGVFEASTEE